MPGSHTRRAFVLLLAVIFFEIFLGRFLEIFSVRPDLFIVFIVFWAFAVDRGSAPEVACVLGLVKDVFSFGTFGVETLSTFFVGCLASITALKVDRDNIWIQGSLSGLFSMACFILYAMLNALLSGGSWIVPASFWGWSLLHSVYTALLAAWFIHYFEYHFVFKNRQLSFHF